MKKVNVFKYLFLLALPVFFVSCEDDNENENESTGKYSNGTFIINEGSFSASNADVTFIGANDSVEQSVFANANNSVVLGSVLQSAYYYNGQIFLVVNNSNKVAVVNAETFKQEQQIDGLVQPRYMTVANGKGYITQWDSTAKGQVKVVDLTTYKVTKTIEVGDDPEGIVLSNGKLWVANSGYGNYVNSDSTISIIDPSTDKVLNTITVAESPRELTVDKDGNVWVLTAGVVVYDWNPPYAITKQTSSSLVKVNVTDNTISKTIISIDSHPSHIDISADKSKIYYGCNGNYGIYEVSVSNPSIPSQPIIAGWFYGFNVNPKTGDIYVCDVKDYKTAGEVTKYSSTGTKIKSYTAGLIPNGVLFTK